MRVKRAGCPDTHPVEYVDLDVIRCCDSEVMTSYGEDYCPGRAIMRPDDDDSSDIDLGKDLLTTFYKKINSRLLYNKRSSGTWVKWQVYCI